MARADLDLYSVCKINALTILSPISLRGILQLLVWTNTLSPKGVANSKKKTMTNSVHADERLIMSRLIRIYTVCKPIWFGPGTLGLKRED